MNREKILSEANNVFAGLINISENLYKGELKMEDKSAGIYFIDLRGEINVQEFKDYQEEILSDEYYKQKEELQWNLYLLFIANNYNPSDKEIIESNQKYARKYVFTEEEFIDYFKLDQKAGEVQTDIVVEWKKELDEADLQEVHSDETYTDAVSRFLTDTTLKVSSGVIVAGTKDIVDIEFINQIILTDQYRKSPDERDFRFGRVNLFKGVNGSGKTSTLEAVELIVCGRNFRNKDRKLPDHCLSAIINGNINESCVPSDNAKYRLRDQKWYSNVYGRDNFIFNSFNRFNFFDSDAASNFSQSNNERQLKDALQNLVLGEEFKYIKDRVNGFLGRLGPELNRLIRQRDEANEKKSAAEAIIARDNKELAANLLLSEVNKNLKQLKLKISLDASVNELGKVDIVINELKTLLDRIFSSKLDYEKNLKSLYELQTRVGGRIILIDDFKSKNDNIGSEIFTLEGRLSQLTSKTELLQQAMQILENPKLLELEGLRDRMNVAIKEFKNIERIEKTLFSISYQSLKNPAVLNDLIDEYSEQELLSHRELSEISLEISNRIEVLGKIEGLVKQIRELGNELILLQPEIEHCPLCDTAFKPNELRMKVENLLILIKEDEFNESSKDLNERKNITESRIKHFDTNLTAYKLIANVYQDIFNRDAMILPLQKIIEEIDHYYSNKFTIESTKEHLEDLINYSNEIGVSEQKLQEIKLSIRSMDGKNYEMSTTEATIIREEYKKTEDDKKELLAEIEKNKMLRDLSYRELITKLGLSEESKQKIDEIRSNYSKENTEILSLLDNYNKLSSLISFSTEELAEDINQRLLVLEKNLTSLKSAIEIDSEVNIAKKNKDDAEKFLKDNKKKKDRLQKAVDILEKLNANAGTSEMSEFFDSNVKQIVEVFRLIHSPREFVSLRYNDGIIKLIDGEGIERSVTEISTGQRSALALSIFISMNRMLTHGPDIILFDDPVSHIDDLNALSFLDFLRIFLLRERKQIFFASANARLSKLFERKFDFLGDTDFKKWDLTLSKQSSIV